mgnify:CR=1 FL=1
MKNLKQYIQENRDRFIDELFEILKIPSISADPKYKEDVLKCAELVKNKLIIFFSVELQGHQSCHDILQQFS